MAKSKKKPVARLASLAELVAIPGFVDTSTVGCILFRRQEHRLRNWVTEAHDNYYGMVLGEGGIPYMCGCGGSMFLCRKHAMELLV